MKYCLSIIKSRLWSLEIKFSHFRAISKPIFTRRRLALGERCGFAPFFLRDGSTRAGNQFMILQISQNKQVNIFDLYGSLDEIQNKKVSTHFLPLG